MQFQVMLKSKVICRVAKANTASELHLLLRIKHHGTFSSEAAQLHTPMMVTGC